MSTETFSEPTNLGMSEGSHSILMQLKEAKVFGEMADGYRFAIALALSLGQRPTELQGQKVNVFGVATIDPDQEIYIAIKSLIDTGQIPVYRWAERLADWGIRELDRRLNAGNDLSEIVTEIGRSTE